MQLKKIYQFYISGIESFYERQHYFKMLLAEKYALKRKSKLIKSVSWSKEQEKEFNTFWRQEYKPITSKGHKLIEAFNGTFNVEYMPDFLFATKVEYKMNPYLYAKIYSDKSLTEVSNEIQRLLEENDDFAFVSKKSSKIRLSGTLT